MLHGCGRRGDVDEAELPTEAPSFRAADAAAARGRFLRAPMTESEEVGAAAAEEASRFNRLSMEAKSDMVLVLRS